jgi:hypothetical protein
MVVMSFFDEPSLQTPEPEEPEPQRPPWRGTSDDTTGVVVPLVRVLARTEDVAIIVSGFVAYPLRVRLLADHDFPPWLGRGHPGAARPPVPDTRRLHSLDDVLEHARPKLVSGIPAPIATIANRP